MDQQKYALISPASILRIVNDKRDRKDPKYLDWIRVSLAPDIAERGIRNALQVMRAGDKWQLLAGGSRLDAAMYLGLEKVPVSILDRPLTPAEMLREQLLENEMRRDFTDIERAELYAGLMAMNNWTQADLAADLKVQPGSVSKVMAVSARLPPEIKAMVADGKIGPRAAYQLSRLGDFAVMHELADRLIRQCLKVEALEAEVGRRLGKRLKKAESMKLRCGQVAIVVTGNPIEGLKACIAKLGEALKKLERDGSDASYLPALLKGA